MIPFAPIAIFAFNRPDLTKMLLTSLENCKEFRDSEVYVFIDGPRDSDEAKAIESVRAVLEEAEHPSMRINVREKNWGLKASISDGITEVCKSHGRVIVFEDDLELSPGTL